MADWRDNPKPTSVSRPVPVEERAMDHKELNAERRQELEGAYKLGRADALAELAQSDEWKAMVLWMEAFMRINVTTAITDATWESLRDRVEGDMSCACFYEDLERGGYRMGICPLHATTSCSRAEQREYIKRICEENMERTSKTLSPPEVVQALLDGKTVAFSGNLFRYQDGCFASRPQNNPAGPPWRDVAWRAADLLEAFINSPPWSVVPETYDWAEARRRNSDMAVRSQQSGRVVDARKMPTTALYGCEIDAPWEDA